MNVRMLKFHLKRAAGTVIAKIAPLTHFLPAGPRAKVRNAVLRTAGLSRGNALRRDPLPWQPGLHPDGVNLFGFFKAQNGLAQGVKLYARALEQTGLPCRFLNTDFLYWLPQNDTDWDSRLSADAPYAVNVIHINPDQWTEACNCFPIETFDGRYTVGVWLWELEDIPAAWHAQLQSVDELWAPSDFIADALKKVSPVPVTTIPYGITAPAEEGLTRKDFGLPQDKFLVLVMFDSNSYASRKNPAGAIDAFLEAFGNRPEDAHLVIKLNNPSRKDLKFIRERLGKKGPYTLLTDTLSKRRLNGLIRLCDVYLSLHRSEGFGLVMAEAMLLGVPVVATGWSANTQFMTADTACLVDYTLVPVGDAYQYGNEKHRWADPDVHQAAAYLRRLKDDPAWRRDLAARGQRHVAENFSVEKTAALMRRRLSEILKGAGNTAAPGQ